METRTQQSASAPADAPNEAISFALSVFDDVLGDIADWEDKSLAAAVKEAQARLRTIAAADARKREPAAKLRFRNGDDMPSVVSWNSRPAGTYLVYDAPADTSSQNRCDSTRLDAAAIRNQALAEIWELNAAEFAEYGDEARAAAYQECAQELRALKTDQQEHCKTCNDNGIVGNILNAEPCPDCTPSAEAGATDAQPTIYGVDLSQDGIAMVRKATLEEVENDLIDLRTSIGGDKRRTTDARLAVQQAINRVRALKADHREKGNE